MSTPNVPLNPVVKLLPADVQQTALSMLRSLVETLAPYMTHLEASQRRGKRKMGPRSGDFVDIIRAHVKTAPQLLPNFVDPVKFAQQAENVDLLREVLVAVMHLVDPLEDTVMYFGHEVYTNALSTYDASQLAARRGQPAAKLLVQEASPTFRKGRVAKAAASTPQAESEAPDREEGEPPAFEE